MKNFVESLRPKDPEVRKQLDVGYSYDGKVIILFEIRPFWMDPSKVQHLEFAKLRYTETRKQWSLYWMRASGKWELYQPSPHSAHLDALLEVIKEDELSCFFG